jgi:hypothetical protein
MVVIVVVTAMVAMIPMPVVAPIAIAVRENTPGAGKQHDIAY